MLWMKTFGKLKGPQQYEGIYRYDNKPEDYV